MKNSGKYTVVGDSWEIHGWIGVDTPYNGKVLLMTVEQTERQCGFFLAGKHKLLLVPWASLSSDV